MSLPAPWVDRLFDKMVLVYGQSFLRRWTDVDMGAVKSDWAHELASFAQSPRAIAWALQNLPPDKPPNVLEFRALCRRCPVEQAPQIEGPPADPARIAAELQKLAPLVQKKEEHDYKGWARRILARKEAGEPVAAICVRFAKEALRLA